MEESSTATRKVEIAALGERLSALRLCDAEAVTTMRRSLEEHGQLTALTLFTECGALEIIDGFYAEPSVMRRVNLAQVRAPTNSGGEVCEATRHNGRAS